MTVRKRGNIWYVQWKTFGGKWARQRTDARTKTQAKLIRAELMRQVDRQRKGLEAEPLELGVSVWDLCAWWLKRHTHKRRQVKVTWMLSKHVHRSELGPVALAKVRPALFDDYFTWMVSEDYAPRSVNLLRGVLSGVFTRAKAAGKWSGENPIKSTEAREVPRTPRPVLRRDEVEPVLAATIAHWRGFFAVAVYLGLRKGEICGLLKTDYDPVQRTLYVGRSYDEPQTKGKRVDYLPVTDALAPYLKDALSSPGPFLFPMANGKMRSERCHPEATLRRSLVAAGITEGWLHKCRRCIRLVPKYEPIAAADDGVRHCERPGCGFKLWPALVPRQMRFHDLRHTAATHLLQAGVPIQHVQRILRHASIKQTVDTYGHLLTEDLRPALERLGPRLVQPVSIRQAVQSK